MKMKALLFTEWRAARRPGDEPIKRINSEAGALPFCHPGLSSRVPPPFALRCFGFALLCFALVSHLPSLAQSSVPKAIWPVAAFNFPLSLLDSVCL
ncbi:hypothetical protein CBS115989_967 [Aspergillus niger]|nr:hypothetical protein CBS115989_967 [Aspergillus niger]